MASTPPSRGPDEERLLPALRLAVPLEVAVGGQQARRVREGLPEGRLLGHGLHPGVDHPAADRGVLGPGRAPAPSARRAAGARGAASGSPLRRPGRARRRRRLVGATFQLGRQGLAPGARRPRTPRRGPRGSGWPRTVRTRPACQSLPESAAAGWFARRASGKAADHDPRTPTRPPLLASMFVTGGVDALRNPGAQGARRRAGGAADRARSCRTSRRTPEHAGADQRRGPGRRRAAARHWAGSPGSSLGAARRQPGPHHPGRAPVLGGAGRGRTRAQQRIHFFKNLACSAA